MTRKSSYPFKTSFEIAFSALAAAYVRRESFSVASFCARYGFKPNRHTRAKLNELVADRLLDKHKILYEDGKYRMVYCAHGLSKELPF